MKELTIERKYTEGEVTEGKATLRDEGKVLFIFSILELPWLDNLRSKSCIPEGEYKVIHYSSVKYPGSFHVVNVKNRSHILIHAGNYKHDTEGCLLPGMTFSRTNTPMVQNSRMAMNKLKDIIGTDPSFKLIITSEQ